MTTRRTGPSSLRFRLLAAFVLIALFQGCYTLVRHPGIPTLNYSRPDRETACTSCHPAGQRLAFVSLQRVDRAHGPWGALADPWWFEPDDSTRGDGATKQ
jgi:hypothetical protein